MSDFIITNKTMTPKRTHLKTANLPIVVSFIIWCLALYGVFLAGFDSFSAELQSKFHALSRKDGVIVAMMPVLVLVLSGLLSSNIKAILVFWRFKQVLPGHRAFSRLAPADPRIDLGDLKAKIGDIPRAAKDQNALWFKLYKKHETTITVTAAHRSFLLARDLAAMALLFGIAGFVGLLVGGAALATGVRFLGLMLLQFVLLAVAARNYGNRFVCNVLVENLAPEPTGSRARAKS